MVKLKPVVRQMIKMKSRQDRKGLLETNYVYMIYLKDIEIYDNWSNASVSVSKDARCVEDLFLRLIKNKLVTNGVKKINIYIINDSRKHLEYSNTVTGFVDVNFFLEQQTYLDIDSANKKKEKILSILMSSLSIVAVGYKWNMDIIQDVYNKCLELEIKNEWWFKNKLIASPSRTYYIGVRNEYDLSEFKSYFILFDKDKNELQTQLIFKDSFNSFLICKLSWLDDEKFVYKFDGPKKEFIYSVEEFRNGQIGELPEKIHLMFK